MKRIIALLLSAIIACTLSACTKSDNITEIEFYNQNEAEVEIFNHIIDEFEKKYPNIRVKQVNLPEEEAGAVLNTRIQNNDAPDIFNEWFSQDFFNKVELGAVRDVTGADFLQYIDESALEQTAYNGKNYLIPITRNFMGVYYNTNLFKKYNIAEPTTLAELWTACEVLKSNGITPISAGDKDGWNLAHWAQDVIGLTMPNYSDSFLSIFNGEIKGDDIPGISELADVVITRSSYIQEDALGADTDLMISLFANQEAAMMFNGSWQMARLNELELDFDYKIIPFPAAKAEDTMVQSNADFSFALSAQSSPEKQKAAELFVNYVLTDGISYYLDKSGAPSTVKAFFADTSSYEALVPYLNDGRTFRMPYSGRWTDDTYLDYTIALQNLVANGDKETFYNEFEKALTTSGKPQTYIK